jgi:hypothetical protein
VLRELGDFLKSTNEQENEKSDRESMENPSIVENGAEVGNTILMSK